MGQVIISGAVGCGITSDEVTVTSAYVHPDYTYLGSDTDDEIGTGTMSTKAAATYYATTADQTIESGQYLNGDQKISKLSQTNLSEANIKTGIIVKVNNGKADVYSVAGTFCSDATLSTASNLLSGEIAYGKNGTKYAGTMANKGAQTKTFTPNASSQSYTIPAGYHNGSGKVTCNAVSNLSAANIKKGVTVGGVLGTFYGNKTAISAMAARGHGLSSSEYEPSSEESFTMPANGIVYYGGFSSSYGSSGTCTCEIYKNGSVVDSRNITNNDYSWRGNMTDKSFNVSAGDVIKVKCTATSGTCADAFMHAVIVY